MEDGRCWRRRNRILFKAIERERKGEGRADILPRPVHSDGPNAEGADDSAGGKRVDWLVSLSHLSFVWTTKLEIKLGSSTTTKKKSQQDCCWLRMLCLQAMVGYGLFDLTVCDHVDQQNEISVVRARQSKPIWE